MTGVSEKLPPAYVEALPVVSVRTCVPAQTKSMGVTACLSNKSEISVPLECNLNKCPKHQNSGFVIFASLSHVCCFNAEFF